MLLKKNRVDKKLFELVLQKGKFINSPNLSFKFLKIKDFIVPRISFVVPKTVVKSAAKRNLLRRRGYSVLRKYIKNIFPGITGVFFFKKGGLEIFGGRKNSQYNGEQNLDNEIKYIFNQIN